MKDFKILVKSISTAHKQLQKYAANSVNQTLTIRNWLIGYYIVEFEQKGTDRAKYGANLIVKLAKELENYKGIDVRSLHNFKLFYKLYPQIETYILENQKVGSLTTLFPAKLIHNSISDIFNEHSKEGLPTTLSQNTKNRVLGEFIITKLSYTHIEQLIRIDDDLKRTFYEIECISGTWSTRELQRQIGSLYYERSGLSKDKKKLSQLTNNKAETMLPADIIKNPMTFEFLDLPVKILLEEDQLEKALIDILPKKGWEKEIDWVEFRLTLSDKAQQKAVRDAGLIKKRYGIIRGCFYEET